MTRDDYRIKDTFPALVGGRFPYRSDVTSSSVNASVSLSGKHAYVCGLIWLGSRGDDFVIVWGVGFDPTDRYSEKPELWSHVIGWKGWQASPAKWKEDMLSVLSYDDPEDGLEVSGRGLVLSLRPGSIEVALRFKSVEFFGRRSFELKIEVRQLSPLQQSFAPLLEASVPSQREN